MAGRPTDYSEELAAVICERLMGGESLRAICSDEDMPGKTTVFRWLASDPAFRDQYAKAREAQAEAMADEMLDIADNGSNDWMEKNFGEDTRWVENGEAIRRSALRIDTRKWVAARLLPKKYGDKTQLEHTGKDGGPIETKGVSDNELARRVAFMLAKGLQATKTDESE
ncbi:terminase small subunit protein [Sinorhizobium meliloti]|uniref:terminase small subunit-like protein n=1 Tax=Rhizobium meliloti TaxID=382 RepID=UPI000FDACB21|nr:terminase small subunit protein [Sinorhizobium meliloti]RVG88680.1 terminase small subunit protein [Sinorhizobium meliloti]RVI39038.1 terminase small subunit protein [Sinorhizobium meliloti]RVI46673.1 terminase small subunit protein [Sinorhizobium meliloti]RVJ25675.1 terminase small subunit protein [Sinorhizobium meliloti]RVK02246.1 terminase small subunit protein [Sinorhizobium meliloti]